MFKNKSKDGKLNISGEKIKEYRQKHRLSQRALADELLLKLEIDLSKNAIQQIEAGERFVTDIELKAFAKFFNCSTDDLMV